MEETQVLRYIACVTVLLLAASVAYATTDKDDGLSYNSVGGGTGYFDGSAERYGYAGGTYPNLLTSPTGGGWSTEGEPCDWYVSYKGEYHWSGIWDGDDNHWICNEPEEPGDPSMTIIADLEMWCIEHWNANQVYFHQGKGPNGQQQAVIGGYFKGNNGMWIGFTKAGWEQGDEAKAKVLVWFGDGRNAGGHGADIPPGYQGDIPLAWELDDGLGFRGPDNWSDGYGGIWGYWWLVQSGNPGYWPLDLRLTITPDPYQCDGRYYLDPDYTVFPAL